MKKVLKWGLIVFIGLIVLGVIVGAGSSDKTPTASQSETTQPQEAQQITAAELADDFDANQLAAEEKWKGKLIQFSAEISNITDSGLSFYNVGSKEISMTQISCRVEDKQQLLSLKNGENVTVQGVVGKQTIGVIDVSNCVIVE